MENEAKCHCNNCGIELPVTHKGPCPECGKTGKDCKVSVSAGLSIKARVNSKARFKQWKEGFKKFAKEVLQGWFPSGDPRLKNGVDKVRIIDKEKDEYHETVKDAITGEVIRDIHEPLSQHKSRIK